MNKIAALLALFSLSLSPLAYTQDYDDENVFYADDDDEFFNRGKFVGKESNAAAQARKRIQARNWGIALSSTAVGIVTLILAGKNK